MAHYWYAKVLLDIRKAQQAAQIILLARQDAQSLSAGEQSETEELAAKIDASGHK